MSRSDFNNPRTAQAENALRVTLSVLPNIMLQQGQAVRVIDEEIENSRNVSITSTYNST